jgi:hypothetical protein
MTQCNLCPTHAEFQYWSVRRRPLTFRVTLRADSTVRMPAHTKLWYFERFRMISALSEAQRHQLEKLTRMLEVKRRTRIYLPGDPSDQIPAEKRGDQNLDDHV